MNIVVHNMREGYPLILDRVRRGRAVAPRGMPTRELFDASVTLLDPTDALASGTHRELNAAIGIVEAAQLVGGFSDPELTCRIAPNMKAFRDEDDTFHGAYGPRVAEQIPHVLRKLRADSDSRQAVVTLWDPSRDNDSHADIPCTVMLQFLIRDGRLIMHTTMRSNDVWWGLPYDVFQFTQLQCSVANALHLHPGRYHHHAVSLHMYEHDVERSELVRYVGAGPLIKGYHGFGVRGGTWDGVVRHARAVCTSAFNLRRATPTERWMRTRLQRYL